MIIYKATNLINGKIYIGQTVNSFKGRISDHIRQSKIEGNKHYFQRALFKHGPENFKWEVVDECDKRDILNQLEIFYIGYYDTFNNGYNLTTGGDGSYIISDKTKKLMSEMKIGKPAWNKGLIKETDERMKKISKNLEGIKKTEEAKAKMRGSRKSFTNNGSFKKGEEPWNKGMTKKQMQEYRDKNNGKYI